MQNYAHQPFWRVFQAIEFIAKTRQVQPFIGFVRPKLSLLKPVATTCSSFSLGTDKGSDALFERLSSTPAIPVSTPAGIIKDEGCSIFVLVSSDSSDHF